MADDELNQTENPNPPKEEPEPLEAKVSQLEGLLAQKDRELALSNSQISKLEKTVAEKDTEIARLNQSVAESGEQLNQLSEHLSQAVASYKAVVVQANQEVPEELITGDTVESINDSLEKAKSLVSKVRQGLEAEIISAKVPAGVPVRTPPDFSALSAREKIQYAIRGSSS